MEEMGGTRERLTLGGPALEHGTGKRGATDKRGERVEKKVSRRKLAEIQVGVLGKS